MEFNDVYNFNINNKKLNKEIYKHYTTIFDKIISTDEFENLKVQHDIDNVLKSNIKYNLLQPQSVTENDMEYILNFEILGSSNIYGNMNPTKSNTHFTLTEQKNITSIDYAYVVLYFPNYDENMNQKNDYLLSTLLVAYLLKNMYNNYDLTKKHLTGTKAKIICMTTCDIDPIVKNILSIYYDEVKIVPYIAPYDCHLPEHIKNDKTKFIDIQDVSKGHIQKTHGYYKVFTKLSIFNKDLFPYKKVMLLDSDLFPMGYFDTLFSLDIPAGWLEHKRQLLPNFGVSSWIYDREPFCKHGKLIPNILTDIENNYASDINASLLIITPNNTLYESMIGELKTPLDLWFGKDKYHKGFWLGNNYFDYYLLPEQNYLTKRLSGQWKSVDLGFCSWLLDLSDSFGFTFAGFITKPWKVQSAFHKYSINPYSDFSKINNKSLQRSYGCQLLNELIFNMLCDMKDTNNIYYDKILSEINTIKIIYESYDPWEPEMDLNSCHQNYIMNIKKYELKYLSYDQKKLVYMSHNQIDKEYLKKILYYDYVYDNVTRNIFNLEFISMTYKLIDILYDLSIRFNFKNNLFPFGNTLVSLAMFGAFDITDDDNDFLLIIKNKNVIYDIIEELLKINFVQVYVCLHGYKFIKITNDSKYFNNKDSMNFYDFKNNFDISQVWFFNYSLVLPYVENYMENNHVHNMTTYKNILMSHDHNYHIKLPWVDVFYIIDDSDNDYIDFNVNRQMRLSKDIFFGNNNTITEYISKKTYIIPNMKKYIQEYYGNPDKLSYYNIKTHHNIADRRVLFKIDIRDEFNKVVLVELFSHFGDMIRSIKKLNENDIDANSDTDSEIEEINN